MTRSLAITAFITTATAIVAAIIAILALAAAIHPYATLLAIPALAYTAHRINQGLETLLTRHP